MNENKNTIYRASYGEVFIKNFLAGIAKGLGGLFIWLVIMFIGYKLFLPEITNQIEKLNNLVTNLQANPIIQQNQKIPQNLNQLFDTYAPR